MALWFLVGKSAILRRYPILRILCGTFRIQLDGEDAAVTQLDGGKSPDGILRSVGGFGIIVAKAVSLHSGGALSACTEGALLRGCLVGGNSQGVECANGRYVLAECLWTDNARE